MKKLCECNCGGETPLAKKTDARKGWVKGEPVRFIAGHHGRMMLKGASGVESETNLAPSAGVAEITQTDLEKLRTYDDEAAAVWLDGRARSIERTTRRSFIELGMICKEMNDRALYAKLSHPETGVPFHSWNDWAMSALQVSRASAYAALDVIEALPHILIAELMEITRVNLMRLANLSTKVRENPKTIQAAKELNEEAFIAWLRVNFPDQHVEPKRQLLATPTESAATAMEECFDVVKWAYDVTSRNDVLENLCAYFMDGRCEKEGWNGMTNREAYEDSQKGPNA
jgi:hypothetical protein